MANVANVANLGSHFHHTMSLDAERVVAPSSTKNAERAEAPPSTKVAEKKKKKRPCKFCVAVFGNVATSHPQVDKFILGVDR